MRIIWLPHSTNPVFAGVRLRCLLPVAILRRDGVDAVIASSAGALEGAEAAVVQARWLLDAGSPDGLLRRMDVIDRARAAGTIVVLDSFDNYLLNERADPAREAILAAYRACLPRFDRYTVSSPGLVPYLGQALGSDAAITVVGDPLELAGTHRLYESLAQRLNPGRWVSHIAAWYECRVTRLARRRERRLMWFGNHGSLYASGGMDELAGILPRVQIAASQWPLHLTVVSNSVDHYRRLMAPHDIPSSYRDWSRLHFPSLLAEQDLVLIPSRVTPFTASKSNNRLLLPLAHGVPVMADALPDYLPWREFCAIDEWDQLEAYIADPAPLKRRAEGAVHTLESQYSPDSVSRQWQSVLMAQPSTSS